MGVFWGLVVLAIMSIQVKSFRFSKSPLVLRRMSASFSSTCRPASVTGTVYSARDSSAPTVQLFTKEGCTLCDKVKDVLMQVKETHDHSLETIDITDDNHEVWFAKYKYDIPVLHMNDQYWAKHRLTAEEAKEALTAAREGEFQSPRGEPDATAMEQRQAERETEKK